MADPSQEDGQPAQAAQVTEGATPEPQEQAEGFNWMLPVLGAIGFGVGFALTCAIDFTTYSLAKNAFASIYPDEAVGADIAAMRGLTIGALGGAALGLAHRDKMHAVWFALSGAAGFAIAFAVLFSLDSYAVPNLGRTITRLITGSEAPSPYGIGEGVLVGAIGGAILGLAAPKGRLLASLVLGAAGALWFINAFVIGHNAFDGSCSGWNGVAGAIGGAVFGLALALFYALYDTVRPPAQRSVRSR